MPEPQLAIEHIRCHVCNKLGVRKTPRVSIHSDIVLIPTFLADGTVIANDSQESNSLHTTAHGVWARIGL